MPSKPISHVCPVCGVTFSAPPMRTFCSHHCRGRAQEIDPRIRFSQKIVPGPNGCLDWIGSKNDDGYGHLRVDGKLVKAHVLAFTWAHGPLPEGCEPDHKCRRRQCVNEAHLEAVTHRENVRRGTGPSGENAQKRHCIHGHAFTPENTLPRENGGRRCKACEVARSKRRRVES